MDELPPLYTHLIVQAAVEGIPMASIARVLSLPFDVVELTLKEAMADGRVAALPRADWAPSGRTHDRLPTAPRMSTDQIELASGTEFHLTRLESAFLGALLQYDHTDKERLYGIAEQQRRTRHTRANREEPTDPRIVDVMICKLRKKLRTYDSSFIIGTTWGRGYTIDAVVKKAMLDALAKPVI